MFSFVVCFFLLRLLLIRVLCSVYVITTEYCSFATF